MSASRRAALAPTCVTFRKPRTRSGGSVMFGPTTGPRISDRSDNSLTISSEWPSLKSSTLAF